MVAGDSSAAFVGGGFEHLPLRPEPSLGLDLYRRADAHDREADYRAVREAGVGDRAGNEGSA